MNGKIQKWKIDPFHDQILSKISKDIHFCKKKNSFSFKNYKIYIFINAMKYVMLTCLYCIEYKL